MYNLRFAVIPRLFLQIALTVIPQSSDLIKMGYNPYTAVSIIRQAKQIMVQKGYAFYNNRRLGHVPIVAVEEILGVSLHKEE